MAGQGTLVRPPHLQFPSPTQSSDRRIRPFMLFTAVDSRWITRGYHRFTFGTFPCIRSGKSGKVYQYCSLFENYAGYARGWRLLIEFWNDSNFTRINLKAPQHSTERTPPKNSNMIYYHKLERKVKTGLSLTKGSSILEPPFSLDPIALAWNVIKQDISPILKMWCAFVFFLGKMQDNCNTWRSLSNSK